MGQLSVGGVGYYFNVINDNGWIAGSLNNRPVLFNLTSKETIELGSTTGSAYAVNNKMQVVGRISIEGNDKLFLWTKTSGMQDLTILLKKLPPIDTIYLNPISINNNGQILLDGSANNSNYNYLLTPLVVDAPIPTVTPPIETFPPTDKLLVDSGTFIRNHKNEFSPPSQQFFDDNLSAVDRFLLKAPVNKFLTETLSSPGWKSGFKKAEIITDTIGKVLSLGSIRAGAKTNLLLAWTNLGIWSGKYLINEKLKSDYVVRGIFDSAEFVGANGTAIMLGTADPYTALLSFNGIVWGDFVAGGCAALANDPPDPNFTEVYQSPVASTAPLNFSQVTPEINKLMGLELGSLYNTYYYMTGMTTSINRYGSALEAGDAISAGLQFQAFVKYLTLYDESAIQTAFYVKQLKQAMVNQGFSDVSYDKQDILTLQDQIRLTGLPQEINDLFKTIGLTDTEISDLIQVMINYVPPDSLPGSLYQNLSTGINLLHAASSWRPSNPAIFQLLLE